MIPEHKIDEVRDAANIVEVISGYVPLQNAGRLFKGLCPFHAEKTPSFTVNPERRIFHCFGCGVGGNVFRFIMMQKGVTFPEAVTELAERYGIELPKYQGQGPGAKRQRSEKAALYKMTAMAKEFFEDELYGQAGEAARKYLANRGLSPELIREYGLGWAPEGWDNLRMYLESKRVTPDWMLKGGLVKPRNSGRGVYDTFRGRVITPIFDLDGRPIAFGGRLLKEDDRQPKYLNSPESPIFRKGRVLYGLDKCRQALRERRLVFIVEGYFDLLSLTAHGVHHVVATLGTALTPEHLRLLKGYVERAVLIFDADEAGRSAAARALPLFMSADLDGSVLRLPDGHDPDTFVREYGPSALEEAVGRAENLLDFFLAQTKTRYPDSLSGKSRVVQEALDVISRVEYPARQEILRQALADKLGIPDRVLRMSERRQTSPERSISEPEKRLEDVATDFELDVLKMVLVHPETAEEIFSAELGSMFQNASLGRLYEALAEQYRAAGYLAPENLDHLSPDDVDLISGLTMSEDGLTDENLFEAVRDYIYKFHDRDRKHQVFDLSRRIKKAQDAGDDGELLRLLQQKNRLLKEGRTQ